MTGHSIEAEYEGRGERRGGVLYLAALDAVNLILSAQRKGIRVLGEECVVLAADTTSPSMNDIADYSSVDTAWDDAVQFVRARSQRSFMFEVVLGN